MDRQHGNRRIKEGRGARDAPSDFVVIVKTRRMILPGQAIVAPGASPGTIHDPIVASKHSRCRPSFGFEGCRVRMTKLSAAICRRLDGTQETRTPARKREFRIALTTVPDQSNLAGNQLEPTCCCVTIVGQGFIMVEPQSARDHEMLVP